MLWWIQTPQLTATFFMPYALAMTDESVCATTVPDITARNASLAHLHLAVPMLINQQTAGLSSVKTASCKLCRAENRANISADFPVAT